MARSSTLAASAWILGAALAQPAVANPKANAYTFAPSPHAGDLLNAETTQAPETWQASGGMWLTWNENPLKVTDAASGAQRRIVARQLVSELYGAVGFARRLSLGANVPLFLQSTGDPLPAELHLQQVGGTSLGDARVALRGVLLDGGGAGTGLAVSEVVSLPTATRSDFTGEAGATSSTRVTADWATGGLRVALHVGYRIRKAVTVLGRSLGNEWLGGGAAVVPILPGKVDVLGTLDARAAGDKPFADAQDTTLDGLAGVRLHLGELALTAAAGGGLLSGWGSPAFRATVGIAWVPGPGKLALPDNDPDGDGVLGASDECPHVPGLASLRGCPDSDGDGVADAQDQCPDVKGVALYGGCTPTDHDGDGLFDRDDRCPDKAGTRALQGCPDSDGDGIADIDDKCPSLPGAIGNRGCPPDRDGDGVVDAMDKCPDAPGPKERQGCPEQRVVVTKEKIAIAEKVFFETGDNRIKKQSLSLLDDIAKVLKQHPEIKKIRVEGHTDDVGEPAVNLALSQRRAAAVRKYLIGKGVNERRVVSDGYGDTRPLADNATDDGKAQNRRVEFAILERAE